MTTTPTVEHEAVEYETVIGIETHCELSTATKMFCSCPTAFGAEPNTQVCPVCLGEPGTLPVPNRRAVEMGARIGLALGCRIAERSQFHRKNYFYPDMPKNYQISQYDEPLCSDGVLEVVVDGEPFRVGITRAHLEEDTGKSLHMSTSGRIHGASASLLDYNRAGIPLVEIVSEPDLRTPAQARAYAEELRLVLVSLGVSDAKLEEGSMRFDVNVSVRQRGAPEFGVKVELKNLNSLRSLERALAYETRRQIEMVEAGDLIVQETRHFDERTGETSTMRVKEGATDYRYFPEPDLVPIVATAQWVQAQRDLLPELPAARRARLAASSGLGSKEVAWLARDVAACSYFEAVAQGRDPRVVAGWVMGELQGALREHGMTMADNPVSAARLGELLDLVAEATLSATSAKQVLAELFTTTEAPRVLVTRKGLGQVSDRDELQAAVTSVCQANAELVEKYRAGKQTVIGALVGQVMRATGGRGNPALVRELLVAHLGS